MVSIIISKLCFCTFMYVVLTCLLIYLFFPFFYFLLELMVLKEYRLAVSLSLFWAIVFFFYRLCFYQFSYCFSSFLHGFYINFYTSFLLFVNIFMPKTGFYKYSTGRGFFSTFLSYSIFLSSFTAVFLECYLCKILMYLWMGVFLIYLL